MLDTYDRQLRRQARLTACYCPPLDVLHEFKPDEDGRLDDVSRTEARSRGMKFYTSKRLCVLSKIFQSKHGHAVCLRYSANALTRAEADLAKRLHANRRQLAAGASA